MKEQLEQKAETPGSSRTLAALDLIFVPTSLIRTAKFMKSCRPDCASCTVTNYSAAVMGEAVRLGVYLSLGCLIYSSLR
jgi:hypothetical protein